MDLSGSFLCISATLLLNILVELMVVDYWLIFIRPSYKYAAHEETISNGLGLGFFSASC